MKVLHVGTANDRIDNQVLCDLHDDGSVTSRVICGPGSTASTNCREREIAYAEHRFCGRIDRVGSALIQEQLAAFDPDIVHAFTNRALSNTLRAVRRTGHRAKVVGYRGTSGHLSWFDPAAWMSYLDPRVDHIVCVSDAVRRYLLGRRIPAHKLSVIHKGHDPAWYEAVPPADRSEFDLPSNARVVGFVGNMRPVKGADVLIRSLHNLPPALNVHVLLVGDVRDRRLPRLAADPAIRDRVHFTGFRPDAVAVTTLFDLAVMPSVTREGLPKALIECMARRIPCIASDVGGMPELIEHGKSGLIVPPRNPCALAAAIQQVLEDEALREQFRSEGRARIEGAFNIRHTVDKTRALYQSLIGER